MDEAGNLLSLSFPLGDQVKPPTQLRVLPLRNLTIGVLILVGGTLAALPFRRYVPIPDPSSVPKEATGPTMSSLRGTNLEIVESRQIPKLNTLTTTQLPQWRPEPQPVSRRGVPVRYEDLAVPIDAADPSEKNFPASVSSQNERVKSERLETETALNLDRSSMQPLAIHIPPDENQTPATERSIPKARPEEIANLRATKREQSPTRNRALTTQRVPATEQEATAQLASSSSQSELRSILPKLGDQPKSTFTSERKRYWIRQPD